MKINNEKLKEFAQKPVSRRNFLVTGLVVTATAVLAACGVNLGNSSTGTGTNTDTGNAEGTGANGGTHTTNSGLKATPVCTDDDEATPEVTEGPYFTPNSPERTSLLQDGLAGTKLTITGYVLSTGCQPIANALLDFWHADSSGEYDNTGYTLRGHQYTDAKGKFTLQTIVPGIYTGRTRHIHVKAQAPNRQIITTQLFFPNESGNAADNIYQDVLLMNVRDNSDGSKAASFNFVLEV
jgi:protocatechuate 3,4-dioxygenase beta subunit